MHRVLVVVLLVLAVLGIGGAESPARPRTAAPLSAADLPDATTFHVNAAHTGYSRQPLAPPLRQAWSRTLDGRVGYPLIGGGRIYVLVTTDHDEVSLRALRTTTGRTLWSVPLVDGVRYTTALDGNALYLLSPTGVLTRFRADTGVPRWRRNLGTETAYAFSQPPTALGGTVYVAAGGIDGTVMAVDGATGRVRWAARTRGGASSPTVSGGRLHASYPGPHLYGFATRDGSRLWHRGGFPHGGGSSHTLVYRGRLYALELTGLVVDAPTGRTLDAFYSATLPAVHDDLLVLNELGRLHGLRRTDHRHRWYFDAATDLGTPVIVGDHVYAAALDGTVYALTATTGQETWRTDAFVPHAGADHALLVRITPGDGILLLSGGRHVMAYVD